MSEENKDRIIQDFATNLIRLGNECRDWAAECKSLKEELKMEKENEDRLVREFQKANNEVYGLQRQVAALIDNQTRLKAEVERLQSIHIIDSIGIEQLKAEVERLTKVGDVMAIMLQHDEVSKDWNAAKEGKQS
jgi:hypothetical protein